MLTDDSVTYEECEQTLGLPQWAALEAGATSGTLELRDGATFVRTEETVDGIVASLLQWMARSTPGSAT